MTIASRLEEIIKEKNDLKERITSNLGMDLSDVAFVDYHKYIRKQRTKTIIDSRGLILYDEYGNTLSGKEVIWGGSKGERVC